MIEWKTGDLKKALASFFDALKQAQSLNKIKLQANISSNIGLVFQDLERRNEALSWQKKALNLRLKDNDKYGLASTYTNLASAYSYLKKVSLSIYHQKQAIALQKELGDEYGLGISYLNLGADYKIQKNYEEALKYYNLSQAIREKNDDKLGLSFTYMSIATIYSIQQKYKEAITYGEKSLAVATQIKSDDRIAKNSLGLSNIYNKAGNAKKALALLEQYNYHHDKVFNEEMNKKVSELQVKYETEEKEKDLTKAKLQLTQEELSSKQKSIWLIVLGAIVLLGFILFRNFRAKTKLKQEQLLLENKLLEEQTHAKIQEQRLEISRELHDSLGSQLTFISSILDGLKNSPTKLDQAVNNKINTLSDFSENSINELKNTIWALNAKELKLDDLKMKLLNFIKNAAEAKEDVNFNFDFDVANNFQLNSKQAINLFRVFQEIINNALKYAKAKNITASVKQNGNVLAIGIADDGIGFDMAEAEQKSYGIGNIKNRIAEINGKLNIDTAPNKGTNYQLEISLA